ncbi:hypothetical protein [Halochromatium salexigens]|uniref:Lipoprotein n=1 Tax=Halochromatium salexigens TaxID=49447 RepID=A0AAJ0XGF8_HALSE|nr:hypothetical protein [Halochromatium salexigens]MBK5930632.1 hypothetical protein [Halochromatium salexigens]
MKQCVYYGLLVCASLLIGGCASQSPRQSSDTSIGATGPEIQLPGPGIEEARLLAMGMARSKGWRIIEADEHRFLLERSLPPDSPQAHLLNPEGHPSTPKLQVETRLSERGRDVLVGLSVYVVVNPGTETERRIDYTSDYEDALLISLNALANAWLENRSRIASEIPLPPDPDAVVIAEASTNGLPESPTEPIQDTPISAGASAETRETGAPTRTDAPAAAPASSVTLEQPALRRPAGRIRDEFAAAETSEPNEMLVLDNPSPRGLWTFYAEASARERGCEPDERGAVMLRATPAFEFYEIQCTNGGRLMLSCQGGVCRARP